jgi:hypothetical protein
MFQIVLLNRVLIDGGILSVALGIMLFVSLNYNARLFLGDYPKPIRDKVPPLTAKEKRDRTVLMVLLLVVITGVLTFSARQIKAESGGSITFGQAYLNLFLVLMIFNLFDALVIDLVWLTWFKPKFVILPGMEGMEYLLEDYRKQFVDFLKGFVFCAVFSLPFAIVATL